jgi:branched-subunit amino acid transport protein AzlD
MLVPNSSKRDKTEEKALFNQYSRANTLVLPLEILLLLFPICFRNRSIILGETTSENLKHFFLMSFHSHLQ